MGGEALKLFVFGTSNPNPTEWSTWNEITLVLAKDYDQARKMMGVDRYEKYAEVDMTRPAILVSLSEPNWGDDL